MIEIEFIKGGITLAVSILTILIASLFGGFITAMWNRRQKRRELQLSAANQFYELYGEFFAIWKQWNYSKGDRIKGPVHDVDKLTPIQMRWDLYQRACKADGQVETLLVRVSSEHVFETYNKKDREIETLCKFRQAYKILRDAIRDDQILNWKGAEYPPYEAFKCVAAQVAWILNSGDVPRPGMTGKLHYQPIEKEAREALKLITSHEWQVIWRELNVEPSAEDTKAKAKTWCSDAAIGQKTLLSTILSWLK